MNTFDEEAQRALATPEYEFDLNDFGIQPEWDKEDIIGIGIRIHGLSESQFEGAFAQPARSVLYNLLTDSLDMPPYGMLFSEGSVILKHVEAMVKRGHVPFRAVLRKKESQQHKGQSYWYLDKYVQQYDQNGEPILRKPGDNGQVKKGK
jgi:hypothetical protein